MKLLEFKRLFGAYIPDRLSDAYLERMFNAFSYDSLHRDQITFKVSFMKKNENYRTTMSILLLLSYKKLLGHTITKKMY